MKKMMIAAALFICGFAQAQFAFSSAGQPLTNGQVYEFATFHEMQLRVQNNFEETKFLQIRVDNLVNTDGTDMQLCFGQCLYQVNVGTLVPDGYPIWLEPGEMNSYQDHIWNTNTGDGVNYPMDYTITFIETDEEGTPIQDLLTLTYRYNPELSTKDNNLTKVGVRNINTAVADVISVDVSESLKLDLFNANGQLVKTTQLQAGQQNIEASSLASGVYIARFTSASNAVGQTKIVKK